MDRAHLLEAFRNLRVLVIGDTMLDSYLCGSAGRLCQEAPVAVVVSDYGYGVLTPRLIAALARLQHRSPRTLVLDARDLRLYRRTGATVAKPNYAEAVALLGEPAAEGSRARMQQIVGGAAQLL